MSISNPTIHAVLICLTLSINTQLAAQPALKVDVNPINGNSSDAFSFDIWVQDAIPQSAPRLVGGERFKLALKSTTRPESSRELPRKYGYHYLLFPTESGQLDTPAVSVELEDQILSASPINIGVNPSADKSVPIGDIYVAQAINRPELIVGQQALYSVSVYSRRRLLKPQFEDLSFEDFWAYPAGDFIEDRKKIGADSYYLTELRRMIFPRAAKTAILPGRSFRGSLLQQVTRNMPSFGGFFSFRVVENQEVPFALESSPVPIAVRSLPNLPSDTLIGATSASLSIARSTLAEGETLSGEVILESSANLFTLNSVQLETPPIFRIYFDASRVEFSQDKDLIVSKKHFPFSLVPSRAGDYSIKLKPINYYDPLTSKLSEARAEVYKIAVISNPALKQESASGPVTGRDSQPVNESPEEIKQQYKYTEPGYIESLLESYSWQFLLMLAAVILSAAWIVRHSYGKILVLKPELELNSASDFQLEFASKLEKAIGFHVPPERAAVEGAIKQLNLQGQQLSTVTWVFDQVFPLEESLPLDLGNLRKIWPRAISAIIK